MTKQTHGGKRPNAGRKPLPKKIRKVKVSITLTPDHHRKTIKNRSGVIETALNEHFNRL